jgi:hypothetical protein
MPLDGLPFCHLHVQRKRWIRAILALGPASTFASSAEIDPTGRVGPALYFATRSALSTSPLRLVYWNQGRRRRLRHGTLRRDQRSVPSNAAALKRSSAAHRSGWCPFVKRESY